MSETTSEFEVTEPRPTSPPTEVARTEVEVVDPVDADEVDETADHRPRLRIGAMMKQLLEELRSMELDEPSRDRLAISTHPCPSSAALSPDLRDELGRLALPFSADETPTAGELQIAKAQLVGWLEGLVQGMQAMLFAQQMAAQQQLQSMRGELGPSSDDPSSEPSETRPGTYL